MSAGSLWDQLSEFMTELNLTLTSIGSEVLSVVRSVLDALLEYMYPPRMPLLEAPPAFQPLKWMWRWVPAPPQQSWRLPPGFGAIEGIVSFLPPYRVVAKMKPILYGLMAPGLDMLKLPYVRLPRGPPGISISDALSPALLTSLDAVVAGWALGTLPISVPPAEWAHFLDNLSPALKKQYFETIFSLKMPKPSLMEVMPVEPAMMPSSLTFTPEVLSDMALHKWLVEAFVDKGLSFMAPLTWKPSTWLSVTPGAITERLTAISDILPALQVSIIQLPPVKTPPLAGLGGEYSEPLKIAPLVEAFEELLLATPPPSQPFVRSELSRLPGLLEYGVPLPLPTLSLPLGRIRFSQLLRIVRVVPGVELRLPTFRFPSKLPGIDVFRVVLIEPPAIVPFILRSSLVSYPWVETPLQSVKIPLEETLQALSWMPPILPEYVEPLGARASEYLGLITKSIRVSIGHLISKIPLKPFEQLISEQPLALLAPVTSIAAAPYALKALMEVGGWVRSIEPAVAPGISEAPTPSLPPLTIAGILPTYRPSMIKASKDLATLASTFLRLDAATQALLQFELPPPQQLFSSGFAGFVSKAIMAAELVEGLVDITLYRAPILRAPAVGLALLPEVIARLGLPREPLVTDLAPGLHGLHYVGPAASSLHIVHYERISTVVETSILESPRYSGVEEQAPEMPRVMQAPMLTDLSGPLLRPSPVVVERELHPSIGVEVVGGEVELEELERRLARILRDQIRRYYGGWEYG